jgi:LSD1 subclass zinc finger protein
MDTPRLLGYALASFALLAGCAKTKGGQTGDEDALPGGDGFYGALASRGGAGDYAPAASVAALVADSDRVVVGRAVAMRAGRNYVERVELTNDAGARETVEYRTHTAVLELEVERTLKGEERPSLYLEFAVGVEDVAPPEQLPESRVVAFAVVSGRGFAGNDAIEDEGRGLPEGETLYRLTNPDGMAIASADGRTVASITPDATVFGSGDLDDVIAMVESAQGSDAGSGEQDAGARDAGAPEPSADAGSCRREYPYAPGANPVPCASECYTIQASPFDAANACVDFETLETLGCLDGAPPPLVVCVERIGDGQRFLVRSAWPFPSSEHYRMCPDDVSSTVLSAPACM